MAQVGDVLINLATGERLTVLDLTSATLTLRDVWPPGHEVPAHRHPALVEQWTVLDGQVAIAVEGIERVLSVGDTIEAPRGAPHSARNVSSSPATVQMTLTPPGRWLELVARLFAGEPAARLIGEYPDELAPG